MAELAALFGSGAGGAAGSGAAAGASAGAGAAAAEGAASLSFGEMAKQALQNRIAQSIGGPGGEDMQAGGPQAPQNDAVAVAQQMLSRTVDREFQRRLGVSLEEVLASLRSTQGPGGPRVPQAQSPR